VSKRHKRASAPAPRSQVRPKGRTPRRTGTAAARTPAPVRSGRLDRLDVLRHRLRGSPSRVAMVAAAFVVLLIGVLLPAIPTSNTVVRVDIAADTGATLALYLNDYSQRPQVQPLVPGPRRTYDFEGPADDITRLRVDVADRAGAEIRLYGIEVIDGERTLRRFGPQELEGFARYSLGVPRLEPDALVVESTGPGANFDAFRTVVGRTALPASVDTFLREVRQPAGRLSLCLGLAAAALLAVAFASPRGRRVGVVGAASAAVAAGSIPAVLLLGGGLESAEHAVGRATYLGLSLDRNVRALLATYVAAAAVTGLALWFAARRRLAEPRPAPGPAPLAAPATRPSGRGWRPTGSSVAVAAVVVAVLALLVPDLEAAVEAARTAQYPGGFDAQNLLAWRYFESRGLVPMKDYWYPYGNSGVLDAPLVLGPVLTFLLNGLLIAGYGWVFWRAAGRRIVPACLATAALLLATTAIGEFRRYGLSLLVAVVYTLLDPEDHRLTSRPRLAFTGLVGIALFLEPVLVVYAGVGVVALLAVDGARLRSRGWAWWRRRLTADLAGPLLMAVAWVLLALARGQLDGFAEFYASLGASAAYSAEPTSLLYGQLPLVQPQGFVLWAPAALMAVGLYLRLTGPKGRSAHDLGSWLIVLGGVAVLLLQKHAIRQVPSQLLLFPIVGLLLVLLVVWVRRRAPLALGLAVGCVAAALLAQPSFDALPDRVVSLPARLAGAVQVAASPDDVAEARRERFDRSHFSGYAQELAVAERLGGPVRPGGADLFVLGDAAVLYVLLEQDPPWQVNVYNTSPVTEQERVVDWLEEHEPEVVVVDRRSPGFDDIPHQVRIPLVHQHVVARYGQPTSVGPFDILRRLPDGARPDAEYWTATLSDRIDLGHAPSASGYDDELDECGRPRAAGCAPFLRLRRLPGGPAQVEVPVTFGSERFTVAARTRGDDELIVPVTSLWAAGLSSDVALAGPASTGWTAHLVRAAVEKGTLY
jgi:hypothetical protein